MDKLYLILLCNLLRAAANEFASISEKDTRLLSRPKRYVVFPQGSSFSVAFCTTFTALTPGDIFTGGVNLGVNYDLPNETKHEQTDWAHLESLPVMLRRRRRDTFHKLETIFNSYGVDGRACILRTICETSQMLTPYESLVTELLRTVFTLPLERVTEHEPEENHLYDRAHRVGRARTDCTQSYSECPFSLLDMTLGG